MNKPVSEMAHAFHEYIDYFGPQNYFELVNCIEEEVSSLSLEHLILLLKLGDGDPSNFHLFFDSVRGKLADAAPELQERVIATIYRVWDQLYPLTKDEGDIVLNMGVLFVEMNRHEEAITFFKRCNTVAGDQAPAYFNMGICYHSLNKTKEALECLQKAEALDPIFYSKMEGRS
jgi:tetratricopeptide (TPR) repeat protein